MTAKLLHCQGFTWTSPWPTIHPHVFLFFVFSKTGLKCVQYFAWSVLAVDIFAPQAFLPQWFSLHNWWSVLQCVCGIWLFAALWTVARQAPLSMGFSRKEYWRGLPFPFPGDLPDPVIEPASPVSSTLAGGFLTHEPSGNKRLNDWLTVWHKWFSTKVCLSCDWSWSLYGCEVLGQRIELSGPHMCILA